MSDHFSGPRALAGPAGDICDVYAFPSPERPGHLVLAMTVQPLATPDSSFSDAIVCRFRLRPLEIDEDRRSFTFGPEESELVFACTFEAPRPGADGATAGAGRAGCTSPSGETARFRVHDERGGRSDGLRVYAGLRSDPFFIDLPAWLESLETGRLAFKQEGQNSLAGVERLGRRRRGRRQATAPKNGGPPLLAVVGETVVAGKLPIRIERFGRPEIKNHILSTKEFDQVNRDLEVRDLYNLEDAFHMSKDYRGAYRARLNANLAAIDRLDGKTDWPLGPDGCPPAHRAAARRLSGGGRLQAVRRGQLFEIERATLQGRPHETCGGRSLNDDSMATMYTLLVNAGNGPRISDGVDRATVPASDVFPYLAPPNPPPPAAQQAAALAALFGQPTEAPKGGRP